MLKPVPLTPSLALANRIALAPCTRNRADPGELPTAGALPHYASRAAAGHAGQFDMIAFGKLFMANRQLVEAIRQGRALDPYRRELLEQYRGPCAAMHNQRPIHARSTT